MTESASRSNDDWPAHIVAAAAGRVFVLTGAGISAESGIPTYRGQGGVWRQYDFAAMATMRAFLADREPIWAWYRERRDGVVAAAPNAAHAAVAELARLARSCLVVTQNVDDLHERAGLPHAQLVHVHGRILESRCLACGATAPADADDARRACPSCGARELRPAVVWFDEELPPAEVARVEAHLDHGPCDLVLVVGTTASFPYVLDWAHRAAGAAGLIVDVNPEASGLAAALGPRVQHVRARAAAALPALVAALGRRA
jgi:NAD-dependent deacetylase